MRHVRTATLCLIALLAGCGETVYEFDDVTVGGDDSAREPREKSNSQFIRAVYADLIGRAPEVYDFVVRFGSQELLRFPLDEQELLLDALDSVGDYGPMRSLIVAGLVRHEDVDIPDKRDVRDPERFIRDQFRRFLGRDPGQYELRAFLDEWDSDPAVNPRTVIRALIASREYQSF